VIALRSVNDRRVHLALEADHFAAIRATVATAIDLDVRLPSLPFRARTGTVAVGEYTRLMGGGFVPVLQALAEAHGDDHVAAAVVEPAMSYYKQHYGFFPGFTVCVDALDGGYWEALTFSASGDPTGEIGFSANVFAIAGPSGRWAVWGERWWNIALVWAVEAGPWLDAGVPFVSPREALEDFAGYGTWGTELKDDEVTAFLRNVETFG
jgi:hypothetical protein